MMKSSVYNHADTMAEAYNPTRADNAKNRWKDNASTEDKKAFFRWWLQKLREEPLLFLDAAVANAFAMFYPDTENQRDESLIFYRDNIASSETGNESMERTLVSWSGGRASQEDVREMLGTMYRYPVIAGISDKFDTLYLAIANRIPALFCKTLFITWIPLVFACYFLSRRNWNGIICMIPVAVSWLTQFAGPIVLPRYMVAYVYEVPLIIAMIFLNESPG